MYQQLEDEQRCFLCEPDESLVYLSDGPFFAMLGLGPLSEGYSLIATHAHVPSMQDLEAEAAEELGEFTRKVRSLQSDRGYPPGSLTEHGRVAACVHAATKAYEPHCLHAHRLLFPGESQIDLSSVADDVEFFSDSLAAWQEFDWPGQYLYSEAPDGRCTIARAPRRLPRQLLRRLVAHRLGVDDIADWQAHPRLDLVEAGRRRLASRT